VPPSSQKQPNGNARSHHTKDPVFGITQKEFARLCGDAAFWLIASALIAAPLLKGSGSMFTQGPLMLLVVMASVCWALRLSLVHEARAVFSLVGGPAVVLATYVVVRYTLEQAESIARPDMMLALMAGLLFFCLLNNIRHRWQVTFLAATWTALGTIQAIFGFTQTLGGDAPTGTFVTTSDFVIYLQMTFSVALAKFLFSRHDLKHKIVFAFCAMLMAAMIFLSGSRSLWGGLIASLGIIGVYLARRRGWRFRWALTGLCIFLVVAVVGTIGYYTLRRQTPTVIVHDTTAKPAHRQEGLQLPPLWKSALSIGQRSPLLGAGPNMFRWMFPAQRQVQGTPQTPGNAYLGVFAEYGMAGIILVIWLIISFIVAIVQILKLRAERYSSATLSNRFAMALASFAGTTAVLVDACFDFNPRMAGNLLTLTSLMAAGLTCGIQHHGKSDEATYHPGKHSTLRLSGVTRWVIIMALAVFVVVLASRLIKSYPACWLMRFGRQYHAQLDWNAANARYRQAWGLDRRSFEATRALGDLYCARATWDIEKRSSHVTEAIQWYERSLVVNPLAYDVLISMGRLYDQTGQRAPALSAYQRAVQADPKNAAYYVALGLHYQRWGDNSRANDCFRTARELTATYGVLP
jgi:O-antigen ligase